MSASNQNPGGLSEVAAAFVKGEIRKQLGLEAMDLKAGLAIAKNFLQRGAYLEAMRTYVALVLCEPTNVDAQVGLANCAMTIGEHHLALQAASAIVAMAPSDPRGYLLSGRACLALGHLDAAAEDLRDAIKFGSDGQEPLIVNEATQLLQKLSTMPS